MSIIFDFPSDLEDKLEKVDALIEKQYIDQAICQLERYLEQPKLDKYFFAFRKKLLTCFLMKEEFEEAQEVLSLLKQSPANDHWVKAHDVLICKWQGDDTRLAHYGELFGVQSIHYQTLVEFITQLQLFYVSGWETQTLQKLQLLKEATTLEVAFALLSDLQQWDQSVFLKHQQSFEALLETIEQPLVKTSLFELLVNQEVNYHVTFRREAECVKLETIPQSLEPLNAVITQGEAIVARVCPELEELMGQYYRLFCLSVFPFFVDLDVEVAILRLMEHFGVESEEKNDIIVSRLEKRPILNQTVVEVDRFILSLVK